MATFEYVDQVKHRKAFIEERRQKGVGRRCHAALDFRAARQASQ
jgi:hypothetical protein